MSFQYQGVTRTEAGCKQETCLPLSVIYLGVLS